MPEATPNIGPLAMKGKVVDGNHFFKSECDMMDITNARSTRKRILTGLRTIDGARETGNLKKGNSSCDNDRSSTLDSSASVWFILRVSKMSGRRCDIQGRGQRMREAKWGEMIP